MAKSGLLMVYLKLWFVLCLVVNAVYPLTQNNLSLCELEQLVKDLVYPDDGNELHAASLRSQLRNLLDNNNIDYDSFNSPDTLTENEKRSLSSIARNGLLNNGKRNIGSIARLGFIRATPDQIKRSIAALAKNSQLPTSREPETEDNGQTSELMEKRNIGSVARSGMMTGKRNIASLARGYELPNGKRNLASVVRSGRPGSYKRNIASLARGNFYPYFGEGIKRNVGALARDWSLPKTPTKVAVKRDTHSKHVVKREAVDPQEKVTVSDGKNSHTADVKVAPHHQHKRESVYDDYPGTNSEILEPIYQIPELDYDDLNQALNEIYANDDEEIHEDKRFLGSVVRDGWSAYRPMEKRNIGSLARMGLLRNDYSTYEQQKKYNQQQEKRHIGALARPGSTPNKSFVASRSPSLVKDAKALSIPVPSAGQRLAYPPGEHHVNLPQYTKDLFEDRFIHPETITNYYPQNAFHFDYNDNNFMDQLNDGDDGNFVENEREERLCYLRLSKLILFLELNS
ncbi:uncharacterized protein LOC119066834 isoform X2 [Bradysia coprophila]|uniref:uncharacterized protein LOC119066834 isoform X2 n=1 Tax=Bradysia coprophila TaxID=38358 RepID=UPI00187D98D2|nr:uncharacterized protein LOC119066834 isoform X2 [Bradysia coprophila]